MQDDRDSIVRDRAGQPDIRIVQVGWQVNDKAGRPLGEVISRDGTSILVELEGGGERITIPTRLIAEEDESLMLVILSVDSNELEAVSSSSDLADEPTPLT